MQEPQLGFKPARLSWNAIHGIRKVNWEVTGLSRLQPNMQGIVKVTPLELATSKCWAKLRRLPSCEIM